MSIEFEKGATVRVRSGGPKMTVENVGQTAMTGELLVWCVWFDEKRQRQRATFAPESLERALEKSAGTSLLGRA